MHGKKPVNTVPMESVGVLETREQKHLEQENSSESVFLLYLQPYLLHGQ